MDVRDTDIPEVKIFTPKRHGDHRGYFAETYSAKTYAAYLGDMAFVQDNESLSAEKHTLRGLHYQAPPFAQDKLLRVLRGRVFDVVVDARRGSPTYGKWVGAELSAERGEQIIAPKGFLHAFLTLEPDTIVAYKVTAFYDKASDGAVRWNSPALGIAWPVGADQVVLSEKDAVAVDFDAFQSPFVYDKLPG